MGRTWSNRIVFSARWNVLGAVWSLSTRTYTPWPRTRTTKTLARHHRSSRNEATRTNLVPLPRLLGPAPTGRYRMISGHCNGGRFGPFLGFRKTPEILNQGDSVSLTETFIWSVQRLERERAFVQIYGDNWVVILFMVIVAGFMGMLLLTLNQMVAPSKPNPVKSMPYESGIPDIKPVEPRYTPRFYVVAMLFVVFDLEVVFIYPWAVSFDQLGLFGFVDVLVFLSLLTIGYIYAWKKGALEWV